MALSDTRVTDSFETFDPNKPSPDRPKWGVYDGGSFRTWKGREHAINAFLKEIRYLHARAKLYELGDDGVWREVAVADRKTHGPLCDRCGKDDQGNYSSDHRWVFERASQSKLAEPLNLQYLCTECRR